MFTISDTLVKAISWTLVHTVWQGFILAFLAGIVITMTKKATAVLRYNLLVGLFLAFIIMVGLTFDHEYRNANEGYLISENFKVFSIVNGTGSDNFFALIVDFLNANANSIVLIWFVVFCIKSFSICSNLSHIYKIRNYRNQPVADYWKERLETLSQAIQLDKRIVLLESQLVKVPSVTGFFKPIILLPIGLLSQLPQDQVEAILLHELAHIRRKDYVVNLLQSFAEIVFFFNPGVLWLSSLIKEERENCCDDIAVSVTQCKSKFVHALVSFQEYNRKHNELIMGFGGKKNQLLGRARRIIHNDTKSLSTVEKTMLSIAVFAVIFVMVVCNDATVSDAKERPDAPAMEVVSDQMNPNRNSCDLPAMGPLTEIQSQTKQGNLDALRANLKSLEAIKSAGEMDLEKHNEALQKAQSEAQKAQSEADRARSKTTTHYEKNLVCKTDDKAVQKERLVISADKILEEPEKISLSIINDLAVEKIISGKENLSYNLSETQLIVNGTLQSDAVHQKFKQKYLNEIAKKHPISTNISIAYNMDISNRVACN